MWEALNLISKKTILLHCIRMPYGIRLQRTISAGSSLAEIKTMLGHQNFNTTLIYAEIPTEELRHRNVTASPLKWYKIIFVPGPKSSGAAYKY
jgi:site-specific recombinase XerD